MTYRIQAMKEAGAFVSSLDRSILGRFAVDEELLVLDDALVRLGDEIDPTWATSQNGLQRAIDDIRTEMTARRMQTGSTSFAQVHGELWFWRQRFPTGIDKEAAALWIPAYELISTTDTNHHEFFARDIWDMDFIASCIADDIDPEMALKLRGASR